MTRVRSVRARRGWVLSIGVAGVLGSAGCPTSPGEGTTEGTSGGADSGSSTALAETSLGADSSGSSGTTAAETTAAETTAAETTGEACEITTDPGRCRQPGYDGPGECDPYAQDCPAGEKCLPYDPDGMGVWDSTRCTPIAADAADLGEPCTMLAGAGNGGEDDCDAGLVCWDLVGNQGICAELCGCGNQSPTCNGEGDLCAVLNGGAVGVCRPACVPTDPQACDDNQVCTVIPGGLFQCLNALDDLGEGEVCNSANDCAPGLLCAGPQACDGAEPCCRAYCDTAAPDDCGGNCVPLFGGGSPHECYDDLGLCIPS